MQRPTVRAGRLLSRLPLSTCKDNSPFSQKVNSIYLENPELNFPPIGESKICCYCLISLGHEVKTRFSGNQDLSPRDLTSQERGKIFFPFFYFTRVSPLTFLSGFTHTHKPLVQIHIQHDTKKCSLLHSVTRYLKVYVLKKRLRH